MAQFHKGDTLFYFGNHPYILGDGQKVDNQNTEVTIKQDLDLSTDLFELAVKSQEPQFNLDVLHEQALKDNAEFNIDKKLAEAQKGK
jgi:hypothetical protein